MVKRLIAKLEIKGIIATTPEEEVNIYQDTPLCINNGITLNITENPTYEEELIIQYDDCEAKIKYWSVPSENVFTKDAYGTIIFPEGVDKNNIKLRLYAKTTSFGGNSEVSSCTGQISLPSIVYITEGWGEMALSAKLVGCENGNTSVYLDLYINYTTSGNQVYDELFLPNGFDEWLIFEVAVSKENYKAEIIIKDVNENILKQISADLDPDYWDSNLNWYMYGRIYGNSSVYGVVTEKWGVNLDIMMWEVKPYSG